MTVTVAHASLIAEKFIRDENLQPTCAADIVLLHKQLTGETEHDALILKGWLETREHVKKSSTQKTDDMIDIERERTAFGPTATTEGRAVYYRELRKATGDDTFAESRRAAWGATAVLKSGTEPGTGATHDDDTVKKAAKIVADESSNSPFNPRKNFQSPETRANECAKYIVRFGTRAAQAQCAKFSTDIAGRPLARKSA
jgi:hypothetical protein